MLDPTGVGFAFGGVTPGQLHSKGVLHELHKVRRAERTCAPFQPHPKHRTLAP